MTGFVPSVSKKEIEPIIRFEDPNPERVLGPKIKTSGKKRILSVRTYLPRAKTTWVNCEGRQTKMNEISKGFFEAQLDAESASKSYTILQKDESGYISEREDPYSFHPVLSEYDIYLFNEGTSRQAFEKLGAHLIKSDGVEGVHFAVWAPNAKSVGVVGNFNHWTVGETPMLSRGASGIWEIFVPRLKEAEVYKFAVKSKEDGGVVLKTDPFAFHTELRPHTSAIVVDLNKYKWNDGEWMKERERSSPLEKPMSIYEMHLGSWRRKGEEENDNLTYREIADELLPYVLKMGFTHIELLPVMEHPLDASWGYQVSNYFAPTSRFGLPADFMYLIDQCHQHGIGVILDWVPGHFPKDEFGLGMFDGTHLYEHADPRIGVSPEWGTYVFNFDRREVRSFLVSNAVFWLEKYHADGLRLDAVANMLYLDFLRRPGNWLPNEFGGNVNLGAKSFLREVNEAAHEKGAGILMIAEESTSWKGVTHSLSSGGLGFDLKWNMGWMHDTLDYFAKDPLYRKYHHGNLTFSLLYAFNERFILVFSHDEVVYGKRSLLNKMPGDEWQKFANLRLCLGYMFTHPGKKLIFMGSEFAQWNEWYFKRELDWSVSENPMNSKFVAFVQDLNRLYKERREFYDLDFSSDGFEWIDFKDEAQSVISYLRKSKGMSSESIVVCNMTPVPRHNYRIGAPRSGVYKEILNSDATRYGGSGVANPDLIETETIPWHSREFSLNLSLPPLGILILSEASSEKK